MNQPSHVQVQKDAYRHTSDERLASAIAELERRLADPDLGRDQSAGIRSCAGRRSRGAGKAPRMIETGRVRRWWPREGFGFIVRDDGGEIFGRGPRRLRAGQPVEFSTERTERGLRATNIRLLTRPAGG